MNKDFIVMNLESLNEDNNISFLKYSIDAIQIGMDNLNSELSGNWLFELQRHLCHCLDDPFLLGFSQI